MRFQRVLTTCCCIFKEITLVGSNNVINLRKDVESACRDKAVVLSVISCSKKQKYEEHTLCEVLRKLLLVFDDVSKSVFRSKVDVEVRESLRNGSSQRFVTERDQLLVVRPFTLGFLSTKEQLMYSA